MNQAISIILLIISFINIILIGVFTVKKKNEIAFALAFLQILLIIITLALEGNLTSIF